uniref:Serine proteinase stubble n=4 Tax=Cacopsylla melanoneura TaxID=428564 RepID=A0A8D8QZ95_9HEMI
MLPHHYGYNKSKLLQSILFVTWYIAAWTIHRASCEDSTTTTISSVTDIISNLTTTEDTTEVFVYNVPGKPSKFDEFVEEEQYVDNPLGNSTTTPSSDVSKDITTRDVESQTQNVPIVNSDKMFSNLKLNLSNSDSILALTKNSTESNKTYLSNRTMYLKIASDFLDQFKKKKNRMRKSYNKYFDSASINKTVLQNALEKSITCLDKNDTICNSLIFPDYNAEYSDRQKVERKKRFRRKRALYAAYPVYYQDHSYRRYDVHYPESNRRFVRFPILDQFRPPPNRIPTGPGWQPPLPPPQPNYNGYLPVPSMGPRSPRLVFRDPVEPGTLQAPFGGNGLQDLTAPEDNKDDWPLEGKDNKHCASGSCEFFLSCWMSSGLIEGACGNGFLYACCHRNTAKASDHHEVPQPLNYGPVQNDPRCGVSVKNQGAQRRIVGGDEAGFGSFPWQAYIRIGSSRCGGSLVNRFHVVTAGHCVARASARQVQVTLGDYVINSAVEPLPAYTFGVRKINVHPYFKFTPQADRYDVAVLRLDRPVQYMPHIAPICLPDKGEDFLGQFGWAAGWGALQAGSRLRPKTLQAVDVPIIDNRQCERWHKSNGINVVIYDEMMCAGYRGGAKDSCQGDSGGPLMMERTNRWFLIGIVSAGYSCAQQGQPGIYHRVAYTVDWISYIMNTANN